MTNASKFVPHQIGQANTPDYKVFLRNSATNEYVSPFHDVPLWVDRDQGIVNMIVEIPRWTNAKLEICKEQGLNPIVQDVKKGKLRFVRNCFPHHGYIWNYGALPQTWEDPGHKHPDTNAAGDNDPLDVIEIGEDVGFTGQVKQVKILGVLALLDEGETDWKIVAIDTRSPLASVLSSPESVRTHLPGLLEATVNWFKVYKMPDGKPENQFAFNGEVKGKDYAIKVVEETNAAWKDLISGKVDAGKIRLENTSVKEGKLFVSGTDAQKLVPSGPPAGPAGPIDSSVDKWFFFNDKGQISNL